MSRHECSVPLETGQPDIDGIFRVFPVAAPVRVNQPIGVLNIAGPYAAMALCLIGRTNPITEITVTSGVYNWVISLPRDNPIFVHLWTETVPAAWSLTVTGTIGSSVDVQYTGASALGVATAFGTDIWTEYVNRIAADPSIGDKTTRVLP